jgi:hypothetical protein
LISPALARRVSVNLAFVDPVIAPLPKSSCENPTWARLRSATLVTVTWPLRRGSREALIPPAFLIEAEDPAVRYLAFFDMTAAEALVVAILGLRSL